MKTVSAGLATLLASSNQYVVAECYTFTLANGTVLKFTTIDFDVTYGLNTWLWNGPVFERTSIRTVIGLEVGTLNLNIYPKDSDLIGSQTWMQAVCSGALDGAMVSLDHAYMASGSFSPAGTVNKFVGYVAQIVIDRFKIDMTVNTPVDALSIQMPRNIYQAGCQHTLYDGGCAVNKATFTRSGSVGGAVTKTGFLATIGSAPAGSLNLGTLQFVSGVLTGTKRTVKSWDAATLALLNPLPIDPAVGDAFTVTFGCDKQLATCGTTFSNQPNFKGFPFVPVPETAV